MKWFFLITLFFTAFLSASFVYLYRHTGAILCELNNVEIELAKTREEIKRAPSYEIKKLERKNIASRWIDVQKNCRNSVLQVFSNALAFNWLEPYKVPEQGEGCGSGFFIDEDGHFLTNYHVVAQALRVQVQMPLFGEERFDATIVGVSPDRDLALLRLGSAGRGRIRKEIGKIPFLKFGRSDCVQRGEEILALGFPLAMEHIKSTQGIVSGWERVIFGERGFSQLCFQITAPINPGSSGGPSLNGDCEVIGINFAGAPKAQNVGYVIPIDDVRSAIKDLHKVKLLRKPRLGCALHCTNEDMAKLLKVPEGGGLYVAKVMEGSLTERSGLKKGDVIREINGHLLDYQGNVTASWSEDKVSGMDLLNRLVVGDEVTFVVYRDGKRKKLKFVFEKDEVQPIRFVYPDYEDVDYEVFGGIVVMELSLNHIAILSDRIPTLIKYALPENTYDKKLIVTHVQPTSSVHNMRGVLSVGSLLCEISGVKVSTLNDLRTELKRALKNDFVQLKTEDDRFAVVSTQSLLSDEQRLFGLFQYDKTHSVMLAEASRLSVAYA